MCGLSRSGYIMLSGFVYMLFFWVCLEGSCQCWKSVVKIVNARGHTREDEEAGG